MAEKINGQSRFQKMAQRPSFAAMCNHGKRIFWTNCRAPVGYVPPQRTK